MNTTDSNTTNTPASKGFHQGQIVQVISAFSTDHWGAEMILLNDKNAVVVYQDNSKVALFVWEPEAGIFTEYNGDDEETPVRYFHAPGGRDEVEVLQRIEDSWPNRKYIQP